MIIIVENNTLNVPEAYYYTQKNEEKICTAIASVLPSKNNNNNKNDSVAFSNQINLFYVLHLYSTGSTWIRFSASTNSPMDPTYTYSTMLANMHVELA